MCSRLFRPLAFTHFHFDSWAAKRQLIQEVWAWGRDIQHEVNVLSRPAAFFHLQTETWVREKWKRNENRKETPWTGLCVVYSTSPVYSPDTLINGKFWHSFESPPSFKDYCMFWSVFLGCLVLKAAHACFKCSVVQLQCSDMQMTPQLLFIRVHWCQVKCEICLYTGISLAKWPWRCFVWEIHCSDSDTWL